MAGFQASVDAATSGPNPAMLGIVIMATDSKGNTILGHASGKTNLRKDAKFVDLDSIFRLASCTKLVTAIAVLRLLSTHSLDLDDADLISIHLPELIALPIITSLAGQLLTYAPRTKPLTLRHLLTHTSGIGYDANDPRLREWRKGRKERTMMLHGPLPGAVATPLLFEPGECWAYGGGLDWVGVFIERVSGVKFGKWLRDNVFDVVGCDERIGFDKGEMERAGEIVQVVSNGNGGKLKEFRVKEQELGVERGGGGLFSSASNFVKLLVDIISPSPKLLPRELVALLFTPSLLHSSPSLAALHISASSFKRMAGALMPSGDVSGINHSLAGLLVTQDNEALGNVKGTVTWAGAFNTMWFANRERGVAGFYASALWPPGEEQCSRLMEIFLKETWKALDRGG